GECAVVIVVVEAVLAEVRDIDIRPAIVVVVRNGDTETPALVSDARFVRHVRECAVVIVVQQHRAGRRFFTLQRAKRRSVQQVNIEPAIVVVVEQRDARSRSFDDRLLLRRSGAMVEFIEARLLRDVNEYDGRTIDEAARRDRAIQCVLYRRVDSAGHHAGRFGWRWLLLLRLHHLRVARANWQQTPKGTQQQNENCADERCSRSHCEMAFAPGVAASSICKIWSARTFVSVWTMPLGQRISIDWAEVSLPRPKCTRLSLEER